MHSYSWQVLTQAPELAFRNLCLRSFTIGIWSPLGQQTENTLLRNVCSLSQCPNCYYFKSKNYLIVLCEYSVVRLLGYKVQHFHSPRSCCLKSIIRATFHFVKQSCVHLGTRKDTAWGRGVGWKGQGMRGGGGTLFTPYQLSSGSEKDAVCLCTKCLKVPAVRNTCNYLHKGTETFTCMNMWTLF